MPKHEDERSDDDTQRRLANLRRSLAALPSDAEVLKLFIWAIERERERRPRGRRGAVRGDDVAQREDVRMPANRPKEVPPTPDRAATILLVEDDMDTRDLLSRLLTAEGYAVKVAANGWEGLLAVESLPDMILLDMMLPGMDGVSFLTSLSHTPRFRSIPVVVVTAMDVRDLLPRLKPYGVQQVISKGDTFFPKLKAALSRCLEAPPQPYHVDLPTPAPGEMVPSYLELYVQVLAWR